MTSGRVTQALLAWTEFVRRVQDELSADNSCIDFHASFESEHALNEHIVMGLRDLFRAHYPLERTIHDHVLYRNGREAEDRRAWHDALPRKYVVLHGLRFVPDVLIQRSFTEGCRDVLPVDIKLLTKPSCSQPLATAIGQSLIYSLHHSRAILFVAVNRGVMGRRRGISDDLGRSGVFGLLKQRLQSTEVCLILREVGA